MPDPGAILATRLAAWRAGTITATELLETAAGVVPDPSKIVEGRIQPTNALMILPIVGF